tara:strand:- start:269 stop:685 length:417 start_codon:yes stop_codon:yes gene_type:complete
MLSHFFSMQFLGFLLVGITAASANWLSRLAISKWVTFVVAVPAAYAVGMSVAFILNSSFIFPKSTVPVRNQIRRFIIINVSFFPLVCGVTLVLVEPLEVLGVEKYAEELAHAIALTLPMLITFLLYKFFAFGEAHDEK